MNLLSHPILSFVFLHQIALRLKLMQTRLVIIINNYKFHQNTSIKIFDKGFNQFEKVILQKTFHYNNLSQIDIYNYTICKYYLNYRLTSYKFSLWGRDWTS